MTPKAFENGITTVMALGGSTNAVLHLLAMSRAAGCPLDLADFQRISDKTPFIADLKPSGKYLMEDLHKVCCPDSCLLFFLILDFFCLLSMQLKPSGKYLMEDLHKVCCPDSCVSASVRAER